MNLQELQQLVGRNIRDRRNELSWTQEDLAFHAGLNRSYLSGVESGLRNISLATLITIANALEVDVARLFENTAQERNNE